MATDFRKKLVKVFADVAAGKLDYASDKQTQLKSKLKSLLQSYPEYLWLYLIVDYKSKNFRTGLEYLINHFRTNGQEISVANQQMLNQTGYHQINKQSAFE